MLITLFGLTSSGTTTIGRELARRIHFEFFSAKELLKRINPDYSDPSFRIMQIQKRNFEDDIRVDNTLISFRDDEKNRVIAARMGWFYLPNSTKILIKRSRAERYERRAFKHGCTYVDAMNETDLHDKLMRIRYKKLYNISSFPPSSDKFDIVLNVTKMNEGKAVDTLMQQLANYLS